MMVPAPIELPGHPTTLPIEINTDIGLTRSLSLEFPGWLTGIALFIC
jgi:hypothetical protein